MAVPDLPITARDGTLVFEDGTGTPISYTLDWEEGNLSFDDLSYKQRERIVLFDRDDVAAVRLGRRKIVPFKFTCYPKAMSDGSVKLLNDLVHKTGAFASAVSTKGANEEAMLYKLTFTMERSNFGGSADSTVTANYVAMNFNMSEEPGGFTKFEVSGEIYIFSDGDFVIA